MFINQVRDIRKVEIQALMEDKEDHRFNIATVEDNKAWASYTRNQDKVEEVMVI